MAKKKVSRKGRPVLDKGEFDHLNMRVAKDRKARWQKAADAAGLPLSQWVRDTLDKAASKP